MIYGIERLGEKKIRIGAKEFRLGVTDRPLPDGTYMGVDAAGRPHSEHQPQLDLELFKGSQAQQLFKGLYIGIYSPIVESTNISYIELANPYGNPTLLVSMTFDYADWLEESNLILHCKRLAEILLKQIPGCTSTKSKAADVSVDINLRIDIPQTADIYEFVHATDQKINTLTRQAAEPSGSKTHAATSSLKPDEHGYKWWVRYALIPLAGSALLVAIVKYFGTEQT